MAKVRVFTSFDAEHDEDLRNLVIGQAKNPDSPFDIADWSVREQMTGDWRTKVRARIKAVDQMLVICGEHTDSASGVSSEILIAQEVGIPYFLLHGRSGKASIKPKGAKATDKIYNWTWDNLKTLIGGGR